MCNLTYSGNENVFINPLFYSLVHANETSA